MKNKIDVFLCDVRGTYTTKEKMTSVNRNEIVNKFIDSLENLIKSDNCNTLVFCFVSTDRDSENEKYIKEFIKFITEKESNIIYFNFNSKNNKCETKIDKMLRIVKNYKIRNLYLADDTELYHKTLDLIMSKLNTDINGTKFKVNNGLIELTNKINNYCSKKKYIEEQKKHII